MSKLVICAFLLAALSGCGQKGPLYEEQSPVNNQTTSPETGDTKEST